MKQNDITVRGIPRQQPLVDLYVRALLRLARELVEKEERAEASQPEDNRD